MAAVLAGGVGERNESHGLQNDHADEENGNHGHEPVLVGEGRRQRDIIRRQGVRKEPGVDRGRIGNALRPVEKEVNDDLRKNKKRTGDEVTPKS